MLTVRSGELAHYQGFVEMLSVGACFRSVGERGHSSLVRARCRSTLTPHSLSER